MPENISLLQRYTESQPVRSLLPILSTQHLALGQGVGYHQQQPSHHNPFSPEISNFGHFG